MILCFSGTGNSSYVARRISEATGDEIVSLNEKIKENDTNLSDDYDRLIIVAPTYAWRMPKVVADYLLSSNLKEGVKTYFVMTCGGEIGDADSYNIRLCGKKRLIHMGTKAIVMPDNYIVMFKTLNEEEAKSMISKAESDIVSTIGLIKNDTDLLTVRRSIIGSFLSGIINPIFSLSLTSKPYRVLDKCTSCGLCEKKCPLNNITITNGKPTWGKNCTHCMACISYCPLEAIEYGNKSVGKCRYKCPL